MDRHFDEELKLLKEKIVRMSTLAQEMIEGSIMALKDRREDLITKVFDKEKLVNSLQIEIDDYAFKLIALHQPAASDLRFIIAAIKINADVERIGDLAVNIVERAQDLLKEPPLKPLVDLPRMALIAQAMVCDAINAFIGRDSSLGASVCKRDDEVDNLNNEIFRELFGYMVSDSNNINRAIDLILVARHLERIADHATNIGEDVIYMVKGHDIRHHHLEQ
jgi:phosphate transport system protein